VRWVTHVFVTPGLVIVEVFTRARCRRDAAFRLDEPCDLFEPLHLEPLGVHSSWAACKACGAAFLFGGPQP
jgi:hypothetical protein